MTIVVDLIWGDDDETQAFAHAHNAAGVALTFRASSDNARLQGLASRIVARFHERPVTVEAETFPTRAAMRSALHDAIVTAWPHCVSDAAVPYAIVEIDDDDSKQIKWHVSYESTPYQQFLDALLPADSLLASAAQYTQYIDEQELVLVHRLSGRGTSAAVRRVSTSEPDCLHVLKGIDFGDFLASREEFTHNRDVFYCSIQLLRSMPRHPNILPPPSMYVVSGSSERYGRRLISGTLYPFMAQGTLDDQVSKSKRAGTRICVRDKARWCLQMSSALAHTHRTARTFHMDIKPANILVDNSGDAILIDWEQSGAPLYTLAPEANGDWDVEVDEAGESGAAKRLVYKLYHGETRVNLPKGRPAWNVFPEWSRRWPKACEAAEVFSLGRTMWMMLQEVPQGDVEDLRPEQVNVTWNSDADDIPSHRKDAVMQCLKYDPNERIELTNLVRFWEEQQSHTRLDTTPSHSLPFLVPDSVNTQLESSHGY